MLHFYHPHFHVVNSGESNQQPSYHIAFSNLCFTITSIFYLICTLPYSSNCQVCISVRTFSKDLKVYRKSLTFRIKFICHSSCLKHTRTMSVSQIGLTSLLLYITFVTTKPKYNSMTTITGSKTKICPDLVSKTSLQRVNLLIASY